jgi:Tfp pilus assembly protein PilF
MKVFRRIGVSVLVIFMTIGLYYCEAWGLFDKARAISHYTTGCSYFKKGQYEQAISYFSKAIELDPKYYKAYVMRGSTWCIKHDYDRGLNDFNKALEINPQYAEAYSGRAVVWINKGDYDHSIADCTKALEINPQYVKAYFSRGRAWENKGDYNRAVADYTKAIEINPRFAGGYFGRGMLWVKEGDYDRGCSDLQKACELGFCTGLNLAKEKGHCRHKGFDKTEIPERPLRHVVDLAGIVDDATENRMNGYLQELEQKTTVQLVILTIKNLEGESIEDFSIKVARDKWKLGQKGKDNGVLLLISLEDQKYRIEVGYGLEGVFPGSLLDSMGRNLLVPYFRKGDYSTGIFNTTLAIANEIATDSGMKIEGMPKIKHRIRSEE